MKHQFPKVVLFSSVADYVLRIEFDDRTVQLVDLEPILHGPLYGPLRDPALFKQVMIDPLAHTLVWPNGADFDPATLHDWPTEKAGWAARARQWEL